jgi:hypothetical protein
MEVTLYLPYYDYNDDAFNASEDYYSDGEYANAIADDYNRNKDIVYNSMVDFKEGRGGVFSGVDGQTYKLGQKTSQNEDKVAYSSCKATLYDEEGEDDTVDGLITKFAKQESFIEMVEFDLDSVEEEFESEMNMWSREHTKINSYLGKVGEAWVASKEPKRNLKMHLKNNAGEDTYALLENCKIMDNSERDNWILYVERISLIDKI